MINKTPAYIFFKVKNTNVKLCSLKAKASKCQNASIQSMQKDLSFKSVLKLPKVMGEDGGKYSSIPILKVKQQF